MFICGYRIEVVIKSRLLPLTLIIFTIAVAAFLFVAYTTWRPVAAPLAMPTLMPTLAAPWPQRILLPMVENKDGETAVAAYPPPATAAPPQPLPPTNTPVPSVTPTPLPTSTSTATSTPSPSATLPPDVTPSATPYPLPELTLVPGQPQGYLDKFRLVAFYGSPTGPGLGILGNYPRETMLTLLHQRMAQYQPLSAERPILPTYHMIIAVANTTPPYYYANISLELIEEWVAAAQESGVAVILDIQPGQGDVLYIYERVRHLLYNPHVHLAIDPEFNMAAGEVPGQKVGSLYASTINDVQADLNQIGLEIGLNRVLILHQFAGMMLPDKEAIEDYPHVELVIDGDGVGSSAAKIRNYNEYAQEAAFEYGGFKLFPNDGDYPVLAPQEVMTLLEPLPVIIIYQ